MFDFVRKHTRVLQFVLVLLIFPSFVFFGIQGYSRFIDGDRARRWPRSTASKITRAEWDAAHRAPDRAHAPPDAQRRREAVRHARDEARDARRLVRERVHAGRGRQAAPRQSPTSACSAQFMSDPQFASLRNPDGSVNQATSAGRAGHVVRRLRASAAPGPRAAPGAARRRPTACSRRPARRGGGARRAVPAARGAGAALRQPRTMPPRSAPTDAEIEAYYKDPTHAAVPGARTGQRSSTWCSTSTR